MEIGNQPWPVGYRLPRRCRHAVRELSDVPAWLLPAWALAYWLSIASAATVGIAAFTLPWGFVGVMAILLSMIIIARQIRAVECLVHEGSHYNWVRKHKNWNDVLVNFLVAWPVLSEVAEYRKSHLFHHNQFGTHRDSDLQRYKELDLESIERTTWLCFLKDIAKRIPAYCIGWFRSNGTDWKVLLCSSCWHIFVIIVPISLSYGIDIAIKIWTLFWFVPFFFLLPFIRFVGEASEHVYGLSTRCAPEDTTSTTDSGRTVFDATVTNRGWLHRLLFHPFGDGHHVLHHLFPSVPGCRLSQLHDVLAKDDSLDYKAVLPNRVRVTQEPVQGIVE